MKVITITGCWDCPHGRQWNLDHTEYICTIHNKINKTPKEPLKEYDAIIIDDILCDKAIVREESPIIIKKCPDVYGSKKYKAFKDNPNSKSWKRKKFHN